MRHGGVSGGQPQRLPELVDLWDNAAAPDDYTNIGTGTGDRSKADNAALAPDGWTLYAIDITAQYTGGPTETTLRASIVSDTAGAPGTEVITRTNAIPITSFDPDAPSTIRLYTPPTPLDSPCHVAIQVDGPATGLQIAVKDTMGQSVSQSTNPITTWSSGDTDVRLRSTGHGTA